MRRIIIFLCLFLTLNSFKQPSPKTRVEYYVIQTSPGIYDTIMVDVIGKPLWSYNNGKKTIKKVFHYDTVLFRYKPKGIKS